jgi:hypothetical protein
MLFATIDWTQHTLKEMVTKRRKLKILRSGLTLEIFASLWQKGEML